MQTGVEEGGVPAGPRPAALDERVLEEAAPPEERHVGAAADAHRLGELERGVRPARGTADAQAVRHGVPVVRAGHAGDDATCDADGSSFTSAAFFSLPVVAAPLVRARWVDRVVVVRGLHLVIE